MRKRNIYRNSISRITRSAVVLAAALPALLLPSGCERENLLKELAGDEAVMRFSVSESVPELLTKSQAAQSADRKETTEENVIVLTSADGRTIRLVAEEEPLTASTSSASAEATATAQGPATKAAKIYSQSAALADNETFAVWAYNLADSNSPTNTWQLDGGTGTTPAEAKKVTGQNLWKPDADIQYNTSNRTSSYKTRWFAIAPYGAYSGTKAAVSNLVIHENQAPTFTYTVPSAIEDQWDLLAATTASRDVADVSPVSLTFGHVLTGIRFKRDADLDVSRIVVSGVYNSARIDMSKLDPSGSMESFTNVDGTSMPGATTDLWSNRTKSVTAPATTPSWTMDMTEENPGDVWTNGNPKETQYDYAAKDANILMMIPQLTPRGAKITATVGGLEFEGDISGHRWLPGRMVTYRIDYNLKFEVVYNGNDNDNRLYDVDTENRIISHVVHQGTGRQLNFVITTNIEPTETVPTKINVTLDGTRLTGNNIRWSRVSSDVGKPVTYKYVRVEIPAAYETRDLEKIRTPDPDFDPGFKEENLRPFTATITSQNAPYADVTKQVYISPGNLQYRPSTGTWRFASRQWDFVGGSSTSQLDSDGDPVNVYQDMITYNRLGLWRTGTVYENGVKSDNTHPGERYSTLPEREFQETEAQYYSRKISGPRSSYTGWFDLFGWGTSGYNNWGSISYGSARYPWSADSGDENYGIPFTESEYNSNSDKRNWMTYRTSLSSVAYANGDWGVANSAAINATMGMPSSYKWYTPSLEFSIPNQRPGCISLFGEPTVHVLTFTPTDDPSAAVSFTIVQVPPPTIQGVFFFPDGYGCKAGFDEQRSGGDTYSRDWKPAHKLYASNISMIVTREEWLEMQENGCIFLPAAGTRGKFPANVAYSSVRQYQKFPLIYYSDRVTEPSSAMYWRSNLWISQAMGAATKSGYAVKSFSWDHGFVIYNAINNDSSYQPSKMMGAPVRLVRDAQ